MRIKTLILIGLFLLVFLLPILAFAASWDKKPEFRLSQLYCYDSRKDDRQLYVSRLSSTFNYLDSEGKTLVKLTPFYEAKRNIRRALWERQELGLEIGKDVFSWFYLGEVIQGAWLKEDYRLYTKNKTRRPIESETRLMLTAGVLSNEKMKVFLLNEYTYDFDIGAGVRNEIAAGIVIPAGEYLETVINWRHIDRIHDFDSDNFEASVTLVF